MYQTPGPCFMKSDTRRKRSIISDFFRCEYSRKRMLRLLELRLCARKEPYSLTNEVWMNINSSWHDQWWKWPVLLMEFSRIRVEQNEKKFKYTVKSHFYSLKAKGGYKRQEVWPNISMCPKLAAFSLLHQKQRYWEHKLLLSDETYMKMFISTVCISLIGCISSKANSFW